MWDRFLTRDGTRASYSLSSDSATGPPGKSQIIHSQVVKTVNLMLCVILQFKREKKLEWGGRETLPSLALLWGAGEVSREGPG